MCKIINIDERILSAGSHIWSRGAERRNQEDLLGLIHEGETARNHDIEPATEGFLLAIKETLKKRD